MINTKAMLSLNCSTGTNRAHFNWFDEAPRVRKNLHYYLFGNRVWKEMVCLRRA